MDELKHYNVKGTNWYVHKFGNWEKHAKYANGQDNPATVAKRQMEAATTLSHEMDYDWDYGVMDNGKKITEEHLDEYDFSKYKTTPLEKLKKTKIGVCWDFVNYQHDFFKKNGIEDESYLMFINRSDNSDDAVTHTFSVINIGDKKYWFESSNWKYRGIHEIESYEDVIDILSKQNLDSTKDSFWMGVYKYNPDGLDRGLSGDDFMDVVTQKANELSSAVYKTDDLKHSGVKGQKWYINMYNQMAKNLDNVKMNMV